MQASAHELLLSSLLENISDVVVVLDKQGIITFAASSLNRIMGYQPAEVIGKSFLDFVHPDNRLFARTDFIDFLQSNEAVHASELLILDKNGKVHTFQSTSRNLSGTSPINGIVVTGRDVTELQMWRSEASSLRTEVERSLEEAINAIAATVDARDPYTAGHQRHVADISIAIGKKLGLSDASLRGLWLAASIHDVGKLKIPAEILSAPRRLSEIEYSLIKTHAEIGYEILKGIHFPWPIAEIVRQHHEQIDGSGYPRGLKGDQILLEAKILAVADTIEAMAAHRPYRPSLGLENALEEITRKIGTSYDTAVVNACIELFRQDGYQFAA